MKYKACPQRYDSMPYNRVGNSGLRLPAISLGLWHNFGKIDNQEEIKKMLFRAFDLGITHFDLANNYGYPPGSAEKNFGIIYKENLTKYRDELILSTKAGYFMWPGPYGEWGSRKYLIASCDQSLKRMRVDYVDIFYSHRYDPNTPLEETMAALSHIVKSGKALYAGISNYPFKETKKAYQILNELGTPCLIHQAKYSLLKRNIEDGLIAELEDLQLGCIAFSPLAQGLLTDKYLTSIPVNSRAANKHGFLRKDEISESLRNKLCDLNKMATDRNQSLAQMSICWVLKQWVVNSALIGTSSVKQLEDNVASLNNPDFSEEELEHIEKILE
ncbi:aldo/keto reductase [Bacteroidota bacterium]